MIDSESVPPECSVLAEAPALHPVRRDGEHHAVGGHGAAAPELGEVWVLRMEAVYEGSALSAVVEEPRAAHHGDAADLLSAAARLGDHAHTAVAAQVADLLGARLADHGQRGRIVEEPHGHGQGRAVRLHGSEKDDLLGGEKALNRCVAERHRGALHDRVWWLGSHRVAWI